MERNMPNPFRRFVFELQRAQLVLRYSSIVQRSLLHLDLSAREYSLGTGSVFTYEGFRNEMIPRREALYRLHLDLPRYTGIRLGSLEPDLNRIMSVGESVYNRGLAPSIVSSIRNAENKVEALRRYFNVMQLLKLHETNETAIYLFDNIIQILHPLCTDSELITDFALTFPFHYWLLEHENPELVSYVLHHVQRIRGDIREMLPFGADLVSSCLLSGKPKNVYSLLEYGIGIPSVRPSFVYAPVQVNGELWFGIHVKEERRLHLLNLLLFTSATDHQDCEDALRYIWRSIPDPYLNRLELGLEHFTDAEKQAMTNMYYGSIVEDSSLDDAIPRNLQHLCRVTIREMLHLNDRLPEGISQIGASNNLQKYLKLQY